MSLSGILRLEEQHLRDDQVGGGVVDRPDQEHHPLLQQPRVDVVGALAAPALLDDHRHQAEVGGFGHGCLHRRMISHDRMSCG